MSVSSASSWQSSTLKCTKVLKNELWQSLEEQGTEKEARLVGTLQCSHLGQENRVLVITEERGIDKALSSLKF